MTIDQAIKNSRASIEKADLKVLLPLVKDLKPKNILEIGTWRGYSVELWYNAFKPKKLITIESDPETLILLNERKAKQEFAYMDPSPTLIGLDSHSERAVACVYRELGEELLDFLFIDGDHSYEGVKKDYEMYSPLVRRGGIIAFHDVFYHADNTEEADIFWRELKNNKVHVDIKESLNSTGIGVLYKL